MLNAELDHHLESEAAEPAESKPRNHRNGYSAKTVLTDTGKLELETPRDRQGTSSPQLIAKYRRRLPGFDAKIISMYTRGMPVREIQEHLQEIYGTEVSPQLISQVTDAVLDEVAAWQGRPLEPIYPVIFFDALRVKIRAKYPAIVQSWRRNWEEVIPFFAFPADVRRIIYTTNAIESLNSSLRRAVRVRGHFPSDEAATKLIYLVLRDVSKDWKMAAREWGAARTQFALLYGERFTQHLD